MRPVPNPPTSPAQVRRMEKAGPLGPPRHRTSITSNAPCGTTQKTYEFHGPWITVQITLALFFLAMAEEDISECCIADTASPAEVRRKSYLNHKPAIFSEWKYHYARAWPRELSVQATSMHSFLLTRFLVRCWTGMQKNREFCPRFSLQFDSINSFHQSAISGDMFFFYKYNIVFKSMSPESISLPCIIMYSWSITWQIICCNDRAIDVDNESV